MIAVIGCGNLNRTDDGAGVEVIRRLAAKLGSFEPPDSRLFDAGTDGMVVMFRARGATSLIVVDACRTGAEAGAIYEVPGAELEAPPPQSLNLHDFRWQHALYVGRRIWKDEFPANVTVYLIEAQSVDYGVGLTAPVADAADKVAGMIERRLASESPSGVE